MFQIPYFYSLIKPAWLAPVENGGPCKCYMEKPMYENQAVLDKIKFNGISNPSSHADTVYR